MIAQHIIVKFAGHFPKSLLDEGTDPNVLDSNSYSAIHAAASWGSADVLRLLIERGGNINLEDDEGETALFVVESVDMAKLCIELGADPSHKSHEGVTPAEHHVEESPQVAQYIASVTGETVDIPEGADLDQQADQMSSRIMAQLQDLAGGGAADEDRLREIISQGVQNAAEVGRTIGADSKDAEDSSKRQRPLNDPER